MFRNRGGLSNNSGSSGNNGSNNNGNAGFRAPHYTRYWNRNFIIIKYDEKFLAIELVLGLIVILSVFGAYLFAYKPAFEDPIAKVKKTLLTVQLVGILVSIIVTGLVTFLTQSNKENLIRNLIVTALLSILIIIGILGVKTHFDYKYTKEVFGEFYEQYEREKNDKNSSKIPNYGIANFKIVNAKDAYITANEKAYNNFSIKSMLYTIIHVLVVIIIFYLAHRVSSIERKRDILEKDDAILYDEEQNIKF